MRKLVATLALMVVPVALPEQARAQSFEGARLLSLAEAQRALTSGNDSIYVNPAGLALSKFYALEANYGDNFEGGLRRVNVSLVDSQAGPVAGGISYLNSSEIRGYIGAVERRLYGHRFDLALAAAVVEGLSIGVTGRYVTFEESRDDVELEDGGFAKFDVDIGLQYRLQSGFAFAAVAYNLIPDDEAKPYTPRSYGLGVGWANDTFSLETDMRYNLENGKARFQLGASVTLGDIFPIRAGGAYDRFDDSWDVAFGAGVQSKEFGLDVGYRQQVAVAAAFEQPTTPRVFTVALRLLFL
jgi:hypothetical protein